MEGFYAKRRKINLDHDFPEPNTGYAISSDPEAERPIYVYLHKLNKYKCSECEFLNITASRVALHFLATHTKKGVPKIFRCDWCSFSSIDTNDLLHHRRMCKQFKTNKADKSKHVHIRDSGITGTHLNPKAKFHVRPKRFACEECGRQYRKEIFLFHHMAQYHIKKKIRLNELRKIPCKFCSAAFVKTCSLRFHLKRAHKVEKGNEQIVTRKVNTLHVRKCYVCSFYALDKKSFTKHISGHLLKTGVCAVCKDVFDTQKILKAHIKRKHFSVNHASVTEKTLPSPTSQSDEVLNKQIFEENNFKKNEISHETTSVSSASEEKLQILLNFVKKIDGSTMYSQHDLTVFVNSGLQPLYCSDGTNGIFKCSHCREFQSDNLYVLRSHYKSKHLNLYQCFKCKFICRSDEALLEHTQEIHGHLIKPPEPCVCEICGKKFVTDNARQRHKLIHDNIQNYSCPICGQKFIQSCSMKRHLLTHNKIKPFECGVCGAAYSQLYPLKQHLKKKHPEEDVEKNIVRKDTNSFFDHVYKNGKIDENLLTTASQNERPKTPATKDGRSPRMDNPEKQRSYTNWAPDEAAILFEYFQTSLEEKKLPGKKVLLEFFGAYPWFPYDMQKVKNKLMNEIKRVNDSAKPCPDSSRAAWTPQETAMVTQHFQNWIVSRKIPGKKAIMEFMDDFPSFPYEWQKVKNKVMNEISKRSKQ